MASSLSSQPLQHDSLFSLPHTSKYPSSNGFNVHFFPHFFSFPSLRRSLSSPRPQAGNIAERMPHKGPTRERKSRNHSSYGDIGCVISPLLSSGERAERSVRKGEGSVAGEEKKHKNRSRNGGSRGYRQLSPSGSSCKRSREEGVDWKSKKFEVNSTVAEKIGRFGGKLEGEMVKKRSKKAKVTPAEVQFRIGLDMCSKTGDVIGAITLYDSAIRHCLKMEQYHYNVLLYLCSSAAIGFIHPAKSGSSGSRVTGNNSSSGTGELDDGHSMIHLRNSGVLGELDNGLGSTLQPLVVHTKRDKLEAVPHNDRANSNSSIEISNDSSEDGTSERGDRNNSVIPIQVSDDIRDYARTRGFEIYERMCSEKIPLSEAALTSVARMAMSKGNGDMAFEIVKQMKALGITPRLRSYGPAIFAFCNSADIEKAFEVERHMLESGVDPEEPELAALLRASLRARRGDKVYCLLHKLRTNVRQVSPSTADLIEAWFKSSTASKVGKRKLDKKIIEQAIENGGGGWHGLGWLGKGKWAVTRTFVDEDGVCQGCGEKLVTIDLDPIETENFARSVVSIACKRERNSSFQKFQKWLDYYGPFEAVIDAANVGLFSQRKFSLTKVNAVANGIRQKLPSKKWPLIIVHNRRLTGGKISKTLNEKLIEKWRNADAIYATPTGSNDDWYWLYAAIKCKCLIVTNDEMRDHVFQILGNDFFPKWKERHQVHFTFRDGNFEFQMPPPCSIVIQESEKGYWHIPILTEHVSRRNMTWLCATRVSLNSSILPKAHLEKIEKSTAQVNQLRAFLEEPFLPNLSRQTAYKDTSLPSDTPLRP